VGCVGQTRASAFHAKAEQLEAGRKLLQTRAVTPTEANLRGLSLNNDGRRRTAFEILAFPDVTISRLTAIWPELDSIPPAIAAQLEIDARYDVYLRRQDADIAAYRKDEAIAIPRELNYAAISGLSNELRQKLERDRPVSLAQASRIDGMTPAALMLLLATAKKSGIKKSA
jgi:tRNA uridine 5-carboxymethylaminomethyl modification enzyme